MVVNSKRIRFFAIALVLLMANGTSLAQNSAKSPFVVDSTEKVIGAAILQGGTQKVLSQINGQWILLPVAPQGFVSLGARLWYSTTDCSGTPYIFTGNELTLDGGFDNAPSEVNNFVFLPTTSHASAIQSLLELAGDGSVLTPCSQSVQTELNLFSTFTQFDISTLGYTPPFTLKLR